MTIFSQIKDYFVQAYLELRKVSWPSRQEIFSHTIMVLVSIVITMLVILMVDLGLSKFVQLLF
ncbi:MAG: preprotein translocase subunit SecE [Candidatus Nealsonbacteria bacterium CG23_combo_of_CG06-09_8_20_14_all_40_13]|uniref:Protein translocase subunit SecE n=1 Tax=Candidatus Nealsonbacteria bacterium CG23_combo_of_CG06-09_8_20_14_all_40_13 TaxID=1974724 RepID=A0A2G9YRW6_9BACT|nr:MAG: preprotein translocase subunit SecE [Candidatus Nealsonbacteria bacterium CG23_combo_of_CG06-09_8_20_14_all_40_13]PIR71014.1 MAG: preprotein translocase subunit SecE [Candidatus Nealsonbacteria bacterium CG10_big_fil_rev_8_21_14_0_10_40_24]PIU43108.1 MAG: preprotein translocase subunit SecE [Candidatus Nealsonbacteria bacterium CG07_land_8_20_14_0_80_40_10]